MIPYLIPFIAYFLFLKKDKQFLINLISLLAFLLLALRIDNGYDYANYVSLYDSNQLPSEYISSIITQITFLFNDSKYYFLIFGFCTILLIRSAAIKNNSLLILLSYLLLPGFYIESFTLIRQSLSIALVIYGLSLFNSDNKYFYLAIIASTLIHFTSILFVITFFLILLFNKNSLSKIIICFSVILISFNVAEISSILIQSFPKINLFDGSNKYGYSQLLFYLFLFVVLGQSIFKLKKLFYYITLIGLFLTFILISYDGVFIRLCYYFFTPFLFLKWDNILKFKIKNYIWILILIPFFIIGLNQKTFYKNPNSMIPYKTFLNE